MASESDGDKITRRKFSAGLSISAFLAATHGASVFAAPPDEHPAPKPDDSALLRHLVLDTTAPLADMKRFYQRGLGFPVLAEQKDRITFGAGTTKLTFVSADRGKPFYHVAFNIPENKHGKSIAWLKANNIGIHSINHFRHWNAHAVFFLDPAQNLLEFIARHDLRNAASGDFTPKRDALCASEIAFIVNDVDDFSRRARKALGLPRFRGSPILGTDHGILLIFKRGRKWHRPAETHPATVTIAAKKARFKPNDYPFEIVAKPTNQ